MSVTEVPMRPSDGWKRVEEGIYRNCDGTGPKWRAVHWYSITNKTAVLQKTGTGSQSKAKKALAELRLKAEQLRTSSLKPYTTEISTFGEAIDYYLARKNPGRSRTLFARLKSEMGRVRIAELGERFERWLLCMRDEKVHVHIGRGKTRPTERVVSPATLNRLLAWANAALNLCVRNGVLPSNPLKHIRRQRETPRHVALSPTEEMRLLNAVDRHEPHIGPLVRFSLAIPSRVAELVDARRDQLDLVNRVLFIPAHKTKGRRATTKPLPEHMLEYFQNIPAGSPWVFYRTTGGTPRNPEVSYHPLGNFKKSWAKVTMEAQLSGLRFHDLRHVAASRLLAAGVPELAIAAVAGWAPGSNMLSRYWGETPERVLALVRANTKAKHLGHELRLAENA
ncbi:MAG: tyrosine-type recombinase/integrase [Chitinivibrionales bacterium]|nr:tyrosine-type recombinase/integrase [Chitinivibrionales bacterium]